MLYTGRWMNKLMAILFLCGVLAGLGLSVGTSYRVQDQTPYGAPAEKPLTVYDRVFFLTFAAVCMAACLYFVARVRREDLKYPLN
jgi:hypothetical protein